MRSLGSFLCHPDLFQKIIGKPVTLTSSANKESIFSNINNVDIININGKHPSGNVSFQINKINPINMGEVIWVINPEDIANEVLHLIQSPNTTGQNIVVDGGRSIN